MKQAGGFLSGRYRNGTPIDLTSGRPVLHPDRFDPGVPETAVKLERGERLAELAAEVGCELRKLAVAFTVPHPAVASVIVGPRSLAQLEQLLAGASLTLDDAALGRIDEIVPPGSNYYKVARRSPALDAIVVRGRPPFDRAAS